MKTQDPDPQLGLALRDGESPLHQREPPLLGTSENRAHTSFLHFSLCLFLMTASVNHLTMLDPYFHCSNVRKIVFLKGLTQRLSTKLWQEKNNRWKMDPSLAVGAVPFPGMDEVSLCVVCHLILQCIPLPLCIKVLLHHQILFSFSFLHKTVLVLSFPLAH